MNLPNRLTVARFFLTALFVAVLSISWPWSATAGLFLFALASFTDYLDGAIARARNLETNFGRLMDPLADKILIAAAFICLVEIHAFSAWVAVIIVAREFLITGLRLLAATQGIVLSADNAGKHKTIWQIVTVLFFLVLLTWREIAGAGYGATTRWWWLAWKIGGTVLIALATVLTVYSGAVYLWKNRGLIREM